MLGGMLGGMMGGGMMGLMRKHLDSEHLGISYFRYAPDVRSPMAHSPWGARTRVGRA